jgi:hypothetical protein
LHETRGRFNGLLAGSHNRYEQENGPANVAAATDAQGTRTSGYLN